MKKIQVSDVTLKEIQEQGLALSFRERLNISEKLCLSSVDAVELPALINSKENEVICRTIASSVKNAVVKIPVGDSEESLNSAVECVKGADKFCLQVVMPVSTAQMEYFYHVKAPLMQEKIAELVKLSKAKSDCVEFVALDAFRAEDGFVEQLAKTVFDLGAKCITISDDAGVAMPEDFAKKVKGYDNKREQQYIPTSHMGFGTSPYRRNGMGMGIPSLEIGI